MSVGFSFRRSLRQIIFDGQKSDIDSRRVDKSDIFIDGLMSAGKNHRYSFLSYIMPSLQDLQMPFGNISLIDYDYICIDY